MDPYGKLRVKFSVPITVPEGYRYFQDNVLRLRITPSRFSDYDKIDFTW